MPDQADLAKYQVKWRLVQLERERSVVQLERERSVVPPDNAVPNVVSTLVKVVSTLVINDTERENVSTPPFSAKTDDNAAIGRHNIGPPLPPIDNVVPGSLHSQIKVDTSSIDRRWAKISSVLTGGMSDIVVSACRPGLAYAYSRGGPPSEDCKLETYSEEMMGSRNNNSCHPSEMCFERLVASRLMQNPWYNPMRYYLQLEKSAPLIDQSTGGGREHHHASSSLPSLEMAWAYYDNYMLPREYIEPDDKDDGHRKGRRSRLYPVWDTSHKKLGSDFGIGVGLYFSTLASCATMVFVAGILNLYQIYVFANYSSVPEGDGGGSYVYNTDDGAGATAGHLPFLLRGSAICTLTSWVQIQNCDAVPASAPTSRFNRDSCEALRNECDPLTLSGGMLAYASVLVIIVAMLYTFFVVQRRIEVEVDELQLKTSDYTVMVHNPPKDEDDPEEWKLFFEKFALRGVRSCTIVRNNTHLLEQLGRRRTLRSQLDQCCIPCDENNTDTQNLDPVITESVDAIRSQMLCTESTIKVLMDDPSVSEVSRVFVTFEIETDRRHVLQSLSKYANRNRTPEDDARLYKETVLKVTDALGEPPSVLWNNFGICHKERTKRKVVANGVMVLLILLNAVAVYLAAVRFDESYSIPALVIILINFHIPTACDYICAYEKNPTEESLQRSLHTKMSICRWINSALVYLIISSFATELSIQSNNAQGNDDDENQSDFRNLVVYVYVLCFLDMTLTPAITMLDPVGIFKRHFAAPRSGLEKMMNANFQGTHYSLSERFSNTTRILFVCFLYAGIFPALYFFCTISLILTYLVDKYRLLRLWSPGGVTDTNVASSSRFFFPFVGVIHIVMTAYWYSSFPHDNICVSNNAYYYCNQDFLRSGIFPPLPRFQERLNDGYFYWSKYFDWSKETLGDVIWMSDEQELLTSLVSWSAVFALLLGILSWTVWKYMNYYQKEVQGKYESTDQDQRVDFCNVGRVQRKIHLYVPQWKVPHLHIPILACSTDGISNKTLIKWNDPRNEYCLDNLKNDLNTPNLNKSSSSTATEAGERDGHDRLFSIVKEWNVSTHTLKGPCALV